MYAAMVAYFTVITLAFGYSVWIAVTGQLTWWLVWCLVIGYTTRGLGITVGYHRLATHRSFDTSPWLRTILYVWGSMATQGTVKEWVCDHSLHHAKSDEVSDTHSPWVDVNGQEKVTWMSFWHSHMGWIFGPKPSDSPEQRERFCKNDVIAEQVSHLYPVWTIAPYAVSLAIGYSAGGWSLAWQTLVWANFVALFWCYHITWSVNSVCHVWELDPLKKWRPAKTTRDHSVVNYLVALLSFGEGFHAPHHDRARAANHGNLGWDVDLSAWLIWVLLSYRLIWKVNWYYPGSLEVQQYTRR